MNFESCIPRKGRTWFAQTRSDFVSICQGDIACAVLLGCLEFFTNSQLNIDDHRTPEEVWMEIEVSTIHLFLLGQYGRNSILNALAQLEALGFVRVQKQPGCPNLYQLDIPTILGAIKALPDPEILPRPKMVIDRFNFKPDPFKIKPVGDPNRFNFKPVPVYFQTGSGGSNIIVLKKEEEEEPIQEATPPELEHRFPPESLHEDLPTKIRALWKAETGRDLAIMGKATGQIELMAEQKGEEQVLKELTAFLAGGGRRIETFARGAAILKQTRQPTRGDGHCVNGHQDGVRGHSRRPTQPASSNREIAPVVPPPLAEEWNRLVPSRGWEAWSPELNKLLTECARDPLFASKFPRLCEIVEKVGEVNHPKSGYLTCEYALRNWMKILNGGANWLLRIDGQEPKVESKTERLLRESRKLRDAPPNPFPKANQGGV